MRKVNSDHVRLSIYGFYPIDGVPTVMTSGSGRSDDMCGFIDAVRRANGDRTILMILDNSSVHRSRKVAAHAAERDVILLFLPPYSPQFNPIELIWKTIKRRISQQFLLDSHMLDCLVRESFMAEASKESYCQGWRRNFLINNHSKTFG